MVLDERVVNQYCTQLPPEIRLPAMALKDDKHWAVFLYLLKSGEKRFGEIGNEFKYNSNNDLSPVLKDLVEGGLVRRYVKDGNEETDRRATWYDVTDLGSKYLELLIGLILPKPASEGQRGKIKIRESGKFVQVATEFLEYKQGKKIETKYSR